MTCWGKNKKHLQFSSIGGVSHLSLWMQGSPAKWSKHGINTVTVSAGQKKKTCHFIKIKNLMFLSWVQICRGAGMWDVRW